MSFALGLNFTQLHKRQSPRDRDANKILRSSIYRFSLHYKNCYPSLVLVTLCVAKLLGWDDGCSEVRSMSRPQRNPENPTLPLPLMNDVARDHDQLVGRKQYSTHGRHQHMVRKLKRGRHYAAMGFKGFGQRFAGTSTRNSNTSNLFGRSAANGHQIANHK